MMSAVWKYSILNSAMEKLVAALTKSLLMVEQSHKDQKMGPMSLLSSSPFLTSLAKASLEDSLEDSATLSGT